MTNDPVSAPDLRRAIADVYLRPDPPPAMSRALDLMLALMRRPHDPCTLDAARSLLDTVRLRQQIHDALRHALQAESALVALMLLGFRAQADAALCGARTTAGWRPAASILLARLAKSASSEIDRVFVLQLMLLANGPDNA